MFKRSHISIAAAMAVGSLVSAGALAQDAQRVEITGSSIKRIASEGALPVQTLTRADIDRSGAKSAEELIQGLPAMQGFLTASESVNGKGGGVQNAALHTLDPRYTLVLLNGRRLAAYDSGSGVNLASIPLAAVERVEVLTDGASALYGSDAVAGVVNFILRKNQTALTIDASTNVPEHSGGGSSNFAISKGFGDLEKDRFNVMLAFSHDEQNQLNAADRSFAKSGIVPFSFAGQNYTLYQLAVNTTPASVTLGLKNPVTGPNGPASVNAVTFSPNYLKNKACAPNTALTTVDLDKACWFDYAGTVQLIPSSKRDSLFASGTFKISNDASLFGEVVSTKFDQKSRFAPPAQVIALPLTDPLYLANVTPYLAALGIDPANVKKAQTNNRFVDAGGRSYLYSTRSDHIAFGIEGVIKGFDYTASYVHSTNALNSYYDGGFMSRNCYNTAKAAGKIDPFAASGGNAVTFAPCILKELNDSTKTSLDVLSVRGSGEIFTAPGGKAQLGVGFDYTKQKYDDLPSAITMGPNSLHGGTDTAFGAAPGALPVGASRNNWGAFGELLIPVTKALDLSAAIRYDDYSKIVNKYVFDLGGNLLAPATQGNANNKATYKLAMRFRPIDSLLIRGSYGTGFKAPNLDEVTQPVADGGVTSGKYPCPVKSPDPRAADCKGTTQYDLLLGGNSLTGVNGLKPEESTNTTLGMRFEPSPGMSFGLDYWSVKMKNQIQELPETFPFGNPAAYDALFRTVFDAGQGQNKLATLLPKYNLGSSRYEGIDWEATFGSNTSLGKLYLVWSGTYMLRSEKEVDGVVESSVDRFDGFNNATSRIIQRLTTSLKTGMFTNALTWNWRSGYQDAVQTAADQTVKIVNADGSLGDNATVVRSVGSYSTIDWQTRVEATKNIVVTVGVKNLLDKNPPFSIRTAGGGNQIGYDGRYASPLGRQFYLGGNLKF